MHSYQKRVKIAVCRWLDWKYICMVMFQKLHWRRLTRTSSTSLRWPAIFRLVYCWGILYGTSVLTCNLQSRLLPKLIIISPWLSSFPLLVGSKKPFKVFRCILQQEGIQIGHTSVVDPDLQIGGKGQSSRPWDKRRGVVSKKFFGPLGLTLV